MVGLRATLRAALVVTALLLVACSPAKAPDTGPLHATDTVFGVPYVPQRQAVVAGHPVTDLGRDWTAACLYSTALFNDQERALFDGLQPAGGEGRVGLSFTQDFDADGRDETVSYGAWVRSSGDQGNFVLVTRAVGDATQIVLVHEYHQEPRITALTLKPDGTLYFGGGMVDGEVTQALSWTASGPVVSDLGRD